MIYQTIPGQGQGLFLESQKTSEFSGKFCIIDSSNQKVIKYDRWRAKSFSR